MNEKRVFIDRYGETSKLHQPRSFLLVAVILTSLVLLTIPFAVTASPIQRRVLDVTSSIEFDQIVSGTISPPSEVDQYTFNGKNGDPVLVRMTVTSGGLDPEFRLYRPNGSLLCSGQTFAEFVEGTCTLDTDGTHTIFVGAWEANATGNYDLYIQRTNNPSNAISTAFDETKSGSISPAIDLDAHSFKGVSNHAHTPQLPQKVYLPILLGGESGTFSDVVLARMKMTAGTMDPQFRVYRPDGTLLCSGNTYGDLWCAHDSRWSLECQRYGQL